jgi:hypothetical protein
MGTPMKRTVTRMDTSGAYDLDVHEVRRGVRAHRRSQSPRAGQPQAFRYPERRRWEVKIYVATAYANRPEAVALMQLLEGEGHQITFDWTSHALDPAWTAAQQYDYLQSAGAQDFEGVITADALVLINHVAARDAMAEFGAALGRDIPVFVLYPERRTSVFFHRAVRLCNSIPDLLEALR